MPLRQAIWQALCLNATKFVAISDTVLWGRRRPQRLREINCPDRGRKSAGNILKGKRGKHSAPVRRRLLAYRLAERN
jgi:hypothetical protein